MNFKKNYKFCEIFYDSWYYLGFNSFQSTFPVAARTILEEDIDLNCVFTNQKDKKIK
jgi:hypothetical protein